MLDPFQFPFAQRGLAELLVLSVAAGLAGTWIVLRGLAFYSHAVATAAFPGLVIAAGLGFAAQLGALGSALGFAAALSALAGRRRERYDSLTAVVLVGALALGVILASDVFHSGADVETLLFGSLLVIGDRDVAIAAGLAAGAIALSVARGGRWTGVCSVPGAARGP